MLTRGALERDANRRAREFARRGVTSGDLVTLVLPNGFEWLSSCLAAWKLGAVPNPLSARLPARERDAILERANPAPDRRARRSRGGGRASVPAGFEPDPALSAIPCPT